MQIEIRADGTMHIGGYVNTVCRDSRPIFVPNHGKVVEQIESGVFRRAIEKAENVALLLDHDDTKTYASTNEGSLQLKEDNIGLRADAETSDAELVQKARNKELIGWSFGMQNVQDNIEERAEGLPPRRHVTDLELFEVSLIDNKMRPCYTGTSIEQRANKEVICEQRATTDDVELSEHKETIDYSKYEERLQKVKENQNE